MKNNMKTVADYQAKGIEFVKGDVCKCIRGSLYFETWQEGITEFTEDEMISFVPRENKGTQPVGDDVMVDIVLRCGITYTKVTPFWDWSLKGHNGDIISWKPSMEQDWEDTPEGVYVTESISSKEVEETPLTQTPVYTEVMSNNGELPPVGSQAMLNIWKEAVCSSELKDASGEVVTIIAHVGALALCDIAEGEMFMNIEALNDMQFLPLPEDIKSERDIIIEKVARVLQEEAYRVAKWRTLDMFIGTATALYEAGALKESNP